MKPMRRSREYKLNPIVAARDVALALEAGASPAARLAAKLHIMPQEIERIMNAENCATEQEAREWYVGYVMSRTYPKIAYSQDEDGLWRLNVPFEDLKYSEEYGSDSPRKMSRPIAGAEAEADKAETKVLQAHAEAKSSIDFTAGKDEQADQFRRRMLDFYAGSKGASPSISVETRRGKAKPKRETLRLHQLAKMTPQMAQRDFLALAESIKANGVRVPIKVLGKEIVDGRHRATAAAAVGAVVPVEDVTEDEALTELVLDLNVNRRHMTTAQRTLTAAMFILPKAALIAGENKRRKAAEAAKLQGGKIGKNADGLTQNSESTHDELERDRNAESAAAIAADMSNGLATRGNIAGFSGAGISLEETPETVEKINSGEIASAAAAIREAKEERRARGEDVSKRPDKAERTSYRTAWQHLGLANKELRYALAALGDEVSNAGADKTRDEMLTRLHEAEGLIRMVKKAVPK